ncbi:hypothetical protein LQG66_06890 [Bradyrhizobium ontarionense]|uniref:DUF2946 domain-containing protein n=1 Tax=Bradyrhizobium ontarionense TaxID=2898149 RepID=A0ABY3RH92_9BRAD|nr:DUF2946 family protein [Bradyrhizobium sp. A19]UFZ06029.1 hypothetical protein LQG66_06890 [Bradyrhizobium sp. A19]
MRQRLQVFLPIVLIALMVQIMAPIGAAWAAATAASDPLRGIEICHSQPGAPSSDEQRDRHVRESCALCCAAQPDALAGPLLPVSGVSPRYASDVVWRAAIPAACGARACSGAQARAPPAV